MHLRHSRRTLRITSGALLLAAALSSCGFDYATDRVNSLTAGTFDRSADVDILNAVVVSEHGGSGTLIGLLANRPGESGVEPGVLTSVTSDVSEQAPKIEPVEVAPGAAVQLGEAGIRIDGDFEAGDFIDVTFTFENGEEVEFGVPVMTACHEYEGLDNAPGAPQDGEAYSCETEEAPEH